MKNVKLCAHILRIVIFLDINVYDSISTHVEWFNDLRNKNRNRNHW